MGKLKHEERLMYAIGFTEEDLEANRNGQLSERQRNELKRVRNMMLVYESIILPFSIVFFILLLASNVFTSSLILMSITIGILVGINLPIQVLFKFAHDAQKAEAHCSDGRVKLEIKSMTGRHEKYRVIVEQVKLKVSKEIFLAFKNGDPYLICYTPHTKKLLSAEWLRDSDPFELEDIPDKRKRLV